MLAPYDDVAEAIAAEAFRRLRAQGAFVATSDMEMMRRGCSNMTDPEHPRPRLQDPILLETLDAAELGDAVTLGPIERASSTSSKRELAPVQVYSRESLLRLLNFGKNDPTTGFEYASERSAKSIMRPIYVMVDDTEDRFSYGPYACEYDDDEGAESPTKKRKNS